jgi:hypothetical protein
MSFARSARHDDLMHPRVFLMAALGLAVLGVSAVRSTAATDSFRDGDIVFHVSRSAQSLAVQRATRSKYSHMGMVVHRDGKPHVLEAAVRVKYTPLHEFLERGEHGHYVVKRLREADEVFSGGARGRLLSVASTFVGKPYDPTFEWSDERIYCSELIWKIYERSLGLRLGELKRLADFSLDDHAVKKKLHERYGARVPLDENVIAPVDIFEFDGLDVVATR